MNTVYGNRIYTLAQVIYKHKREKEDKSPLKNDEFMKKYEKVKKLIAFFYVYAIIS